MKIKTLVFPVFFVVLMPFLLNLSAPRSVAASFPPTPPATENTPMMFIENVGQFGDKARFQVQGGNGTMWLADDALWITLLAPTESPTDTPDEHFSRPDTPNTHEAQPQLGVNIRLSFVGANTTPQLEPFDRLETSINYFTGNDQNNWQTDVPAWSGVRYVELYPGLDLEITGESGQLLPRLVCQANCQSALQQVRLQVEGAEALHLADDHLILTTTAGDFVLPPMIIAVTDGTNPTTLNLKPYLEKNTIFFFPHSSSALEPKSYTLPNNLTGLIYGTFLGGDNSDEAWGITVDGVGNAYMIGQTYSADFPTTPGTFDPTQNGDSDVFVLKLNPVGNNLVYATFLGGNSSDGSGWSAGIEGMSIAVDSAYNVYLTGTTDSTDFPTTPGAFDPTHNGGGFDTFMVKLHSAGNSLDYATFLGGSNKDEGRSIAIDGTGNAYVTGVTNSTNFPTTPGAFDPSHNDSGHDVFVVKLNPVGSSLAYATFLGGAGYDHGHGITIDGIGNAHVTGVTNSTDFPTTVGAFDLTYNGGGSDAFVVKFNSAGSSLNYATFLGGTDDDYGASITVDGTANAYVTGTTESANFPTTPGAFDRTYDGYYFDAFVVKLNPVGSDLVYATFLGGGHHDYGFGIAVGGMDNAYITGITTSGDFPITPGTFDSTHNGIIDAFAVQLNTAGSDLIYATFLGGTFNDWGRSIAIDAAGNIYVAGETESLNFPTTPGAFDPTHNDGTWDAFVVKLAFTTFTASGQVRDSANNPIVEATISTNTGQFTTTNSTGNYTITGIITGTYTLAVDKSGYSFSPQRRIISIPPDATGQDFVGVADGGVPTRFLALPFAYPLNGSIAIQNWHLPSGRVNSWYDHQYPNYGSGGGLFLYTGVARTDNPHPVGLVTCFGYPNSRFCYDGHNGIDFSYLDPNPATSVKEDVDILAAADGVIEAVNVGCTVGNTTCGGGYGNYVIIDHQNDYFTLYGHLNIVTATIGIPIMQGETIGTMGNTGRSGGTHLHFSVYRDDGDGVWEGEPVDKPVDPNGWNGITVDPWVMAQGPISSFLWEFDVINEVLFTGNIGGNILDPAGVVEAHIPPGMFNGQVLMELSLEPSIAESSASLRTVSASFWLRLLGLSGTSPLVPFTGYDPEPLSSTGSITLTVNYTDTALLHLDENMLTLYRWDETPQQWQPLPTTINTTNNFVSAQTTEVGHFDLQAPPLCPSDTFEIDDSFYGAIPVSINGPEIPRLLDIEVDEDWFFFEVITDTTYIVETQNLASGVDTVVELYDLDGLTLLAFDDNSGGGLASQLTWQAPQAGIYFVRVVGKPGTVFGCDASYELRGFEDKSKSLFLPLLLK